MTRAPTKFSQIGKQYGTKPGFYLIVGRTGRARTQPASRPCCGRPLLLALSSRAFFMDDTPEDHAAIQPLLNQIVYYPLSEFDGKMKTKDWSKLPHFPAPKATGETKWVNPETFFERITGRDETGAADAGEEALYNWIASVLEAAAKDPQIKQTLKDTAVAGPSVR
jgi:hypothetical protein